MDSSNEHWDLVQSNPQDARTSLVASQLTSLSISDEPQIPAGVTLNHGVAPGGVSITFCSRFMCRLVEDFYGDETKRERKFLRKGELVSISGVKPGYWMTHGPEKDNIGWVDVKFLEVYDPDRCNVNHDPIVYRDTSKPANETVWYHFNPHRIGSKEDAEKIFVALKDILNLNSVGFQGGYCVVRAKEDGRKYVLDSFPVVMETWLVKYQMEGQKEQREKEGEENDEQKICSVPL